MQFVIDTRLTPASVNLTLIKTMITLYAEEQVERSALRRFKLAPVIRTLHVTLLVTGATLFQLCKVIVDVVNDRQRSA